MPNQENQSPDSLDDLLDTLFNPEHYYLEEMPDCPQTYNKEPPETALLTALENKNYPGIYAALRRLPLPLGYRACEEALGCTLRAFTEVLDHSKLDSRELQWLVYRAAFYNRPEHLELLLKRGGCANRVPEFEEIPSPLDGAVIGRSLKCVELLLQRSDLDKTFSYNILGEWADAENGDTALDFCLSAIAQAFMPDCQYPFGSLPLPPGLTLLSAVERKNWPLAERICRERTNSAKDLRVALLNRGTPLERRCHLMTVLADSHPALLRAVWFSSLVTFYALMPAAGIPPELVPLVQRLRRRKRIVLSSNVHHSCWCCFSKEDYEPELLLERWQERIGPQTRIALPRSERLPIVNPPQALDQLLAAAEIVGPIPVLVASELAISLVSYGTPRQVMRELKPGGVLVGENLASLLEECGLSGQEAPAAVRAKRAALLAHMK